MKKYVKPVMEVEEIENEGISTFCLDFPSCSGECSQASGCTESITSCGGDTSGGR